MMKLPIQKVLLLIILLLNTNLIFGQDEKLSISAIEKYIESYKTIAINEQMRVGIPASITLAQGIHESAANTSELATKANNHFGIKCKLGWEGETFLHDDDALKECFRKYESDLDSYLDHSNYLKNNRRYSFLFDIPLDNYKEWAVGLRKAGYATNPKYSSRLTELIEKYKLNQYTEIAIQKQQAFIKDKEKETKNFDKIAIEEEKAIKTEKKLKAIKKESNLETEENSPSENSGVNGFAKKIKNTITSAGNTEMLNGLQGFYAKKGQLLLQEAVSRNIKYAKLLELNDLDESPLPSDMFIYLEKKFKKSPLKKNHLVLENETMHTIAQIEGMQLKALRNLNLLEMEEEPATGTRIYLQEEVNRKPNLVATKTINELNKSEGIVVKKTKLKNTNKASEVNIANQVFSPKEIEVQKNNDQDNIKEIAKPLQELEREVIALSPEELAEAQAKLADEISAAKKKEQMEIEAVEAERLIVFNNAKAEAEKEVNRKKEEMLEAEQKTEQEKVVIVVEKQLEIAQPAPKSPSTYNESNVSDELHKMKKIMDEIVYATLPVKKSQKPIVPKLNIVEKSVIKSAISNSNTKTIPAKNPNNPNSKSTSVFITNAKDEKKSNIKSTKENVVGIKLTEKNKDEKKSELKEIANKKPIIDKLNKKEKVLAGSKKEIKKTAEKKIKDKAPDLKNNTKKVLKKEVNK